MEAVRVLLLLSFVYLCNSQEYAFPEDFQFGVGSSAYQIEGAWDASEKGESIWDHLTHNYPDVILDGSNGDVSSNSYHKTEEDIELLTNLGVNFYRFSISWPRLLPTGHSNSVSEDGLRYYNDLINKLLSNGIVPLVTMYHWDLPQSMHELGGWPNPLMVDYFVDYANVLFEKFGDRVKNWITFNEPYAFCHHGYGSGLLAPVHTQDGIGDYLCSYTVLMAHAKTYELYNDKYRNAQQGKIGISLDSLWFEPESDASSSDIQAAETTIQMMLGWFAHPIFSQTGDFPAVMKERIDALSSSAGYQNSRLPALTDEEVELIKNSADFLGINHYTSQICTLPATAAAVDNNGEIVSSVTINSIDGYARSVNVDVSYSNDVGTHCYTLDEWKTAASSWLSIYPVGLRKLLNWIKEEYNNPEVIITENGYSDDGGRTINDCGRVSYHNSYLEATLEAIIEDGCNVKGYAAWSFLDSFEWLFGYTVRFGLHYVDFEDDDRSRTPKFSASVYKNIIETRKIDRSFSKDRLSCPALFPESFQFGVGTSAYQVEGAWNEDGKGENIWDFLTHSQPDKIKDGSNGDIACDTYHNTEGDVQLLKSIGVNFYRFSISWARLFPTGHVDYTNQAGIDYYNGLIEELLANGITPVVTMFHLDLPQALQEIGGWPSEVLVELFVDYAKALFETFGDKVQNWITFDEPYQICAEGFSSGTKAPAYTQDGVGGYMCGKTLLLAHAKAYRLYQENYKATQNGRVGISVRGTWIEPETDSDSDKETAETSIQMHFGWFVHPIFSATGDYPDVMKERVNTLSTEERFLRPRLPSFTDDEVELIRNSADFLGLNHYTTAVCSNTTDAASLKRPSHAADRGGHCYSPDGYESGASTSFKVVPFGLRKMLNWIKDEYANPEVIITANGFSDSTGDTNDCRRVNYYNSYLEVVLQAIIDDECYVTGYTAWSFLDKFEWMMGYAERFGIFYVDFTGETVRPRSPKMSSQVFKYIIENRYVNWEYTPDRFTTCQW